MEKKLITEAERFLNSRHQDKRRTQVIRGLALLVVVATISMLIMPAITMSNEVECGYEEHIHTENCYTVQQVSPQPVLTCAVGAAGEAVIHTHDEFCSDSQGNLICQLPEVEAHTHGPECYQEQRTLLCEQMADPGHQHGASCYSYVRMEHTEAVEPTPAPVPTPEMLITEYVCGMQEGEGAHRHTEECCPEERVEQPLCGLEEMVDQYDEEGNLVQPGHTHARECWYTRVQEKLVCTQEESEDEYDEEGNLIRPGHRHGESCWLRGDALCEAEGCRQPASQGHVHTDECVAQVAAEPQPEVQTDAQGEQWEKTLICGEEERESGHVHADECYEITKVLTCRKQEIQPHAHSESCYDEYGALICAKSEAQAHQHTDACFTTPEGGPEPTEVLTCGQEEHTHTDLCYVKPEPVGEKYYCNMEAHIHNSECQFSSGALKCTIPEHVHTGDCLVPPLEGVTVEVEEKTLELNDSFPYDSGPFHMTISVTGTAVARTVNTTMELEEPDVPMARSPFLSGFLSLFSAFFEPASAASVDVDEFGPVGADTDEFEPEAAASDFAAVINSSDDPDGNSVGTDGGNPAAGEDAAIPSQNSDAPGESSGIPNNEPQPTPAPETVVTSETAAGPDSQVEFKVEEIFAGEKYDAVKEKMLSAVEEEELLVPIQVMAVTAYLDGQELDLSECVITVKVEPSEELKESLSGMSISTMDVDGEGVAEEPKLALYVADETLVTSAIISSEEDAATSSAVSINLTPSSPENGGVIPGTTGTEGSAGSASGMSTGASSGAAGSLSATGEVRAAKSMGAKAKTLSSGGSDGGSNSSDSSKGNSAYFSMTITNSVNPEFTVQFYADLNAPESSTGTSGTTLPFIDTSKTTGLGELPQNGNKDPSLISLGMNADGTIKFNIKPQEVYKAEGKEFNPKLGDSLDINYLDSLRDNDHYKVKELWVLNYLPDPEDPEKHKVETVEERIERSSGTVKDANWTVYELTGENKVEVAFTNNTALEGQTDDKGRQYIVVENGTIMRLVYDPVDGGNSFKATAYDYNISDGSTTSKTITTAANGINSSSNYKGTGKKYAFGNANAGTDYGGLSWGENTLNKANDNGYKGCTFGLVTGLNDKGGVTFHGDIDAPALFDNGVSVKGRTIYPGWNVKFNRAGDTFTLNAVTMSNDVAAGSASNLTKFTTNPNWNSSSTIWSNNFWPMDDKPTAEETKETSDPQFGEATIPTEGDNKGKRVLTANGTVKGSAGNLPASDNCKNHNSYFGMKFSIDFNLSEDYVGPLEYYFYGDDDLWVFLDGTLVCDIGGVHSSVGEYVNLWDYIKSTKEGDTNNLESRLNHAKDSHTLSVFYTERGASGSTCWMQFTVPEISQIYNDTYQADEAGLTIEKHAVGATGDLVNAKFPFVLTLSGIYNNHEYQFLDADGNVIDRKLREYKNNNPGAEVESKTLSGGTYYFELKDGERLQVIGLPIGATYIVEEKYDGSSSTTVQTGTGEPVGGVLAEGKIKASEDENDRVQKTNANGQPLYKGKDGKEVTNEFNADGTRNEEVWVYPPEAVKVTYTNTFLYSLPSTGGVSLAGWYTMACVPLLAAGCLWYKKKEHGEGAEERT